MFITMMLLTHMIKPFLKQRNLNFPGLPPEPEIQSPRECRSTGSASSDVMEPPLIEDLSPDNIHVLRGKKFQLKAKFQGEPPPNVTWYLQKTELKTSRFIIIGRTLADNLMIPAYSPFIVKHISPFPLIEIY